MDIRGRAWNTLRSYIIKTISTGIILKTQLAFLQTQLAYLKTQLAFLQTQAAF